MEDISDLRIAGIDEKRPPRIRKEPYIDLVFRLSHKAPPDWCADFIGLQSGAAHAVKIDTDECLYIQTWVRTPEEIPGCLQQLKDAVKACNTQYVAKIEARSRDRDNDNTRLGREEGPQGRLNRIVAALDFDESQ